MAFEDLFRLSVHAVITNREHRILQLRQTYNDRRWGLPGGALEPGETFHEALVRECKEELGLNIHIEYMSGIYYHSAYNSHVGVFRCAFPSGASIRLSAEHSEYRFFPLDDLSTVQQHRVKDCLDFDGRVKSARF